MPLKSLKVIKTNEKYETKKEIKQLKNEHKKLKKILYMCVDINNNILVNEIIDKLEILDLKLNNLILKLKLL
jgi:hypothetical protein